MTVRAHLSIGEVLTLLQDDFPDITISKIRFLESQGLLDPERTPSGYRKFYDGDIARLRWILSQQRDHFLPLKVIKERLASGEMSFDDVPVEDVPTSDVSDVGAEPPSPDEARTSTGNGRRGAELAALQEAPSPRTAGGGRRSPAPPDGVAGAHDARPGVLDPGETAVSLTLEELLAATGLTPRALGDLERFGLLSGRSLGGTVYYDEEALLVAQLAAGFLEHGVEARHLRMYKVAAEREAGVFEQLVMPLLKQRNAASRAEAVTRLNELAELGERMRRSILRQLLRDELGRG